VFVFPGAGAVGVIDPVGGFAAQWTLPVGAPIDFFVAHNVLALEPTTFTFADSNYLLTTVVP
jgi:hypothetical protein